MTSKPPDPADEQTSAVIEAVEQEAALRCADSERVFRLARTQPFRFNKNFRLHFNDHGPLLVFAETVNARSDGVREWYANGLECIDRPGVLATFHPLIHKRAGGWVRIRTQAFSLAKELRRWIWLTVGEDRWVRIMLGNDPTTSQTEGPLMVNGIYQNDRYITTFSPTGEEHFVGCS